MWRGTLSAELGIGEAARLLISSLQQAGVPHSTYLYEGTPSRKRHPFVATGDGRAEYDVNIVSVNADRTHDFAAEVGQQFFKGRHTAGYWFWELETLPEIMHSGFAYVDEVWTASRFVAEGHCRRQSAAGVHHSVADAGSASAIRRSHAAQLGIPGRFCFLFMFDFFSVMERKNPIGLVNAFVRAFKPNEGPVLVIKASMDTAAERPGAPARRGPDREDIV